MFREDVLLYPINRKQLARYRESYPGGGKNDPTDAMYLARMLRERIATLTALQPDDNRFPVWHQKFASNDLPRFSAMARGFSSLLGVFRVKSTGVCPSTLYK